jgi:hypothetical protein
MTLWWSTTWGKLQPGDLVQAPGGSAWRVECIVELGDLPAEFLLRSPAGAEAWSAHAPGEPVNADRLPAAQMDTATVALALFALRAHGLNPQPGARRWVVSGGACNT